MYPICVLFNCISRWLLRTIFQSLYRGHSERSEESIPKSGFFTALRSVQNDSAVDYLNAHSVESGTNTVLIHNSKILPYSTAELKRDLVGVGVTPHCSARCGGKSMR